MFRKMSRLRFSAALILLAMPCPHQSKHSLRRTPARHVNCHCDSTRCHGIKSFFDPIVIDGKTLRTLRDAARYITKLPKAEHDADEWQAAMEALLLVAEHDGPPMFARIGIMRALNRHVERASSALILTVLCLNQAMNRRVPNALE
jgi:hypothetical protein